MQDRYSLAAWPELGALPSDSPQHCRVSSQQWTTLNHCGAVTYRLVILDSICIDSANPVGNGFNRILGAKDLSEVFLQCVDPDLLEGTGLTVALFQFAPPLSLSEPDPIGRPVGSPGKTRDFHKTFQQHRLIAVAQGPIGSERLDDS